MLCMRQKNVFVFRLEFVPKKTKQEALHFHIPKINSELELSPQRFCPELLCLPIQNPLRVTSSSAVTTPELRLETTLLTIARKRKKAQLRVFFFHFRPAGGLEV